MKTSITVLGHGDLLRNKNIGRHVVSTLQWASNDIFDQQRRDQEGQARESSSAHSEGLEEEAVEKLLCMCIVALRVEERVDGKKELFQKGQWSLLLYSCKSVANVQVVMGMGSEGEDSVN